MLISYKRSQTSIILRVKIRNSSVSTGAGLTGLTNASSGLIISTIADNEASATAYTAGGSTIQTIATLGTYAAPSANNCRFKEVDSTNHKGIYEIQLADARYGVSSAKSLVVSVSGATNAAECDVCIPLVDFDPYSAAYSTTRAGYLDNINNANLLNVPSSPAAVGSAMTLTTGERDSIASDLLDLANGVETGKTVRQALRIIAAGIAGKRSNAGTTTEQYDAIGAPGTARIVGNLDSSGNGTPTLTP